MLKNQHLVLEESAEERVRGILRAATSQEDFGNGRYVRNLLENARMNQAARPAAHVGEYTMESVKTLLAKDFTAPPQSNEKKMTIGFT